MRAFRVSPWRRVRPAGSGEPGRPDTRADIPSPAIAFALVADHARRDIEVDMSRRRKIWVAVFLSLTGASVTMELVAAFLPSPDRPAWTDLLVGNLPQAVVLPLANLLAAWLPGHFIDAYRRKAAGQPPKGNQ